MQGKGDMKKVKLPTKEEAEKGVEIRAVSRSTGEVEDASILEETGTAYDPTKMTVDLTKAEKRRTTALMMAIQAYSSIIIKDAEMYIAVSRDARNGDGPKIQPATMNAMVEAAIQFDFFIGGGYESRNAVPEKPEPEVEKEK